jgi:hypothetical protein
MLKCFFNKSTQQLINNTYKNVYDNLSIMTKNIYKYNKNSYEIQKGYNYLKISKLKENTNIKEGPFKIIDYNNNVVIRGKLINDKLNGNYSIYPYNKDKDYLYMEESNYIDNELDGIKKIKYYDNTKQWSSVIETNYINGIKDGEERTYINNKLVVFSLFDKNKLVMLIFY